MQEAATSPGIAGNDLNRCEVPALQRKDLERRSKEQLYSLQTVVKGGANGRRRAKKSRFGWEQGKVFAKVTGVHQVTGYAENCIFPGIAGNDLNRC